MAECDDGDNAGLVSVFARAPQLCAGAAAGLAFALWLYVVGACAGLIAAWGALTLVNSVAVGLVGVLAMLVSTAGSLVAADWRAEVASRQAWAAIGMAAAELCPAPSLIDPCYLVTTDSHGLESVFRAHRLAAPSAAPDARAHLPAAASVMPTIAETDGSLPTVAELATAPTVAHRISAPWVADDAMAFQRHRKAGLALVQAPSAAASCRARWEIAQEHTASAVRLVANGGIWSDGFVGGGRVLPPHAERAEIVVLSGDQGRRDQSGFPGASTRDGAVNSDELPSCRGPPHATKTMPDGRSADPVVRDNLGDQVPVCAAELHVIETYLDQVLRDMLAPGASARDGETS